MASALSRTPLASLLPAVNLVKYDSDELICSQGDACSEVYYVEEGVVKLTVVSHRGREAVLGLVGRGDFFNEICLTEQSTSLVTAIALIPSSILVLKRRAMLRLLDENHSVSEHFFQHLLARNRRLEESLLDRIFSSSEKRLARTLLVLDKYSHQPNSPSILASISQDTLADMVGTTRSRVNFFMNKFRKLGYIHYNGGIKVNASLDEILRD